MHNFTKTQIIQLGRCQATDTSTTQWLNEERGLFTHSSKNWQLRTGQWLNNTIRDPDFSSIFPLRHPQYIAFASWSQEGCCTSMGCIHLLGRKQRKSQVPKDRLQEQVSRVCPFKKLSQECYQGDCTCISLARTRSCSHLQLEGSLRRLICHLFSWVHCYPDQNSVKGRREKWIWDGNETIQWCLAQKATKNLVQFFCQAAIQLLRDMLLNTLHACKGQTISSLVKQFIYTINVGLAKCVLLGRMSPA